MDHNAVSCRKVNKIFAQGELAVHALSNVDLDVASGGFVCLSGPSGSGKTTLLNMIGGLDRPTEGEIRVAGQRIDQMSIRNWNQRHQIVFGLRLARRRRRS